MQEFVFTPQMAVWISVGIILFAGMLMGAYRLLKLLWGYSHDALFGAFEQGKGFITDAGSIPLSILRIGIFSTIVGLILLSEPSKLTLYLIICGVFALLQHILATIIARRLPVQGLGGILGGLTGALSGGTLGAAVVVLVSTFVSPTLSKDSLIILGVLGGMIWVFSGIIVGVKLTDGEFEGTRSGKILEDFAREIGVWVLIGGFWGGIIGTIFFWSNIKLPGVSSFLGLLLGGFASGFAGTLYGSIVVLFFLAARMLSRFIYSFLKPLLIQLRFKQIICRSCLRYTLPLDSRYELGRRYCEHCQKAVEHTEIPGKVIVTFGNYPKASEPEQRIFVLAEPDFEKKEQPIDVSEVYITPKTTNTRLLERFITYIVNYPPKDDLLSVQILYQGELDDLGVNLKNVLHNTFERVERIH
jgi:hypothetical protein